MEDINGKTEIQAGLYIGWRMVYSVKPGLFKVMSMKLTGQLRVSKAMECPLTMATGRSSLHQDITWLRTNFCTSA